MRAAFAVLPHHLRLSQHQSLSIASRCTLRKTFNTWRPAAATRMCATGPPQGDTAMQSIHEKLQATLSPTKLEVIPTYGDPNGSHVSIKVVSEQFEGLSIVRRHQTVYKVIWEELSGPIHAVDELVTKTPTEDSS